MRRFVYLSGAGAGQGRPQPWFRAKDMAEAAIRESGLEHGILRPSWIYGPGDHSMNRFVAFCRSLPVVPVIGDGRTPVYPDRTSRTSRAAWWSWCTAPTPRTRCWSWAASGMTMDEVIRTIQDVLGRRRPLRPPSRRR